MEAVLSVWLFCISLVVSIIYVLKLARRRPNHSGHLPPSPKALPIIGNILETLGDNPHQIFARLAKTYGPVMSLQLGQVTTIVISSPDMAREVLHTNDLIFSSRPQPDAVRSLRYGEFSVVWSPVNQQWRNLRRVCNTELFTTHSLKASESHRRQKVRELMAHVSESCALKTAVDVRRVVFTTSLNFISNTIFSVDLVNLKSNASQEFKDVFEKIMEEIASPNLADFFPWLRVLDPQGIRRRTTSYFKKLHAIFDHHIDRRLQAMSEEKRSSPNSHADFLDALLHGGGEGSQRLDRLTINFLFADLFGAGSDTTSVVVEWAMAELLRNPRCMARARKEIQSVIEQGKEVDESDVSKLQYLQAVVKETLRKYPPVPLLLPHKPEKTTELGNYVVPAGARVLVNVWAIGRDSSVWPQPDVFMPERFLEKDIDVRGRDFSLIPFGAGRRICVGLTLGLRMVHLMLASLLQCYEWKLPDGMVPENMDVSEKFGLTLGMAVPLRAIPVAP